MRKMKIRDALYDVVTYVDFCKNRPAYLRYPDSVAVMPGDGFVYPLRNPASDIRPGLYLCGMNMDWFKPPIYQRDISEYAQTNIIDFSEAKTLRDVIATQDRLNKEERSILTTINSLTVPSINDTDEPAMIALKEAIIAKHIDLDSYDYRFGESNFPNDKRLLKKDSISLKKLVAYCNALDIRATLTLTDANSDVPNPMGKSIVYNLNFDGKGEPELPDYILNGDDDD